MLYVLKGIAGKFYILWNRIHYCLKFFNIFYLDGKLYLDECSNLWFSYFNILHLCICVLINGDRKSHNILQQTQKRKWFVNLFEVLKFIRQNILCHVIKHNSYSPVSKTDTQIHTHSGTYTYWQNFVIYDVR